MRPAVLVVFVGMCVTRDYVAVMGCPPGVPCWPWYPNSQSIHMPQHQPFGYPMVMHNWPLMAMSDPYAQHNHPVSHQQWTRPQQATIGTQTVLLNEPPTHHYHEKGISYVPTHQTVAQVNRPLSGLSPSQSYPQQNTRVQVPQISSGSSQGSMGSVPHKNFNPTPPRRQSPTAHRPIATPSTTQVFPHREIKPDRRPNYPTSLPELSQRTTPSPAILTPSSNNYLCDVVKRDTKQLIHSISTPATPQGSNNDHSTTNHTFKNPAKHPVKTSPSTRPPIKQPRPTTGQRPATSPNNQNANGTSPSVAACDQYRSAAVSFLDNQVRINGGEFAGRGEFPYMVVLGYARGETLFWACGGSLISERYVLTAAHCTQSSVCISNPQAAMVLRMGQRRLDTHPSAGDFRAEALLPHSAYSFPEVYHDVALVRTDRRVPFSADVRPVCLPAPALPPTPGARWTTAGWGGDGSLAQSAFKGDLKKAEMIELAEEDCPIEGRSRVPKGLGSRILCTQHRRNNACDGDSGGPLVQQDENGQDVLVGVFSSSPSPCSGNKTALFVRISNELKWIEGIVWPK